MSDAIPVLVTPKIEIDSEGGEIGGQEIVSFFPKTGPKTSSHKKTVKLQQQEIVFMAVEAIKVLNPACGLMRQDILKYVMANFDVGDDARSVDKRLEKGLQKALEHGEVGWSSKYGFFLFGQMKETPAQASKKARGSYNFAQSSSKNGQETNSKYKVFGEYVGMALAQLPPELANTTITKLQNLIQRAQTGTTDKD